MNDFNLIDWLINIDRDEGLLKRIWKNVERWFMDNFNLVIIRDDFNLIDFLVLRDWLISIVIVEKDLKRCRKMVYG